MTEERHPRTFQDALSSGEPLPLDRALRLIRAAAQDVDALHARKAIHGSIGPSAFRLDEDDCVTLLSADPNRAHWSPQRQAGEPADRPDDLFALGLVARALLDGHTASADGLPGEIDVVLRAATAWAPSERFASGAELARELDRAAGALTPDPSPFRGRGEWEVATVEPAWAAARRVAMAREAHRLAVADLANRGPRERARQVVHHPMQRPDYPDFPLPGGWVAVLVVVLCSVYLFPLYFMLFPHG